ncbi:protein kinase [Nocardioides sp. TRM66260-LWL]|uniref:protein kinase domain-containing protein n=1 Tax=Nocardioides sp. TRM66260-LWL TaxID=2874478 RepID=UPI001CC7EAE2|nr:protein kinase [Nocardioides sp. TRM66260-LWL]MBZ5735583.1 protein kinase [Nocardioides sp. TRM66260-LWL]
MRLPTRAAPGPGDCVLGPVLGHGATATVHVARVRGRRAPVAAKVLRDPGPDALRAAHREHAARHVVHPALLHPDAWLADGAVVVLVAPLARGGSLATLLATTAPPPGTAACVVARLLDGLAALHAAGLVHRDVTPGNLLLDPSAGTPPRVRLGDHGLTVPVGHREPPAARLRSEVVGTAGAVAPEAGEGHPAHPAQDVWAAGRLLTRLLDAAAPPQPDAPDALGRHALHSLAARLAAPDPADRPTAAEAARLLRAAPTAPDPHPAVPDRVSALLRRVRP